MVDDGSCVTGVWFRDSDFVTLPENCWFPCCVCMAITGKRFHKANTVIFIGDYWAYEMIDHGGSMVTIRMVHEIIPSHRILSLLCTRRNDISDDHPHVGDPIVLSSHI